MKKKVPPKLKKLVLDSVRRHAWNIGVSHFKGDIFYMDEDKRKPFEENSDFWTLAEIDVDKRYLKATLNIFPHAIEQWKEQGDQFIENVIAHEVAHIATQHFFDVATATYRDEGEMRDAWETCTEVIGRLSEKLDKTLRKK